MVCNQMCIGHSPITPMLSWHVAPLIAILHGDGNYFVGAVGRRRTSIGKSARLPFRWR